MNNDGPIFPTGRKKSNLKQNDGPVIPKEKGASPSVEGEGPIFPKGRSVKKKSTMASPSEQNQGGVSLATSTTETKKPSVSSGSESKKAFYGDAGAGKKDYILDETSGIPVWKEYSNLDENNRPVFNKIITNPTRVKTLNKFFKQDASTSELDKIYTGFPGQEDNQYRDYNGSWQRMQPTAKSWTTVNDPNAIAALNRQFKKDIKPVKGLNVVKEGAKFTDINTKLVSQTEGNVVPYLQKKYNKLGFTFEEAGIGQDYVTVTSRDGKKVDISLDEANPEEALKLRHFISQNASTPESKKSKYLKIKREEDPNYSKSPEYINALKSLSPDDVEDIVESRKEELVTNLKAQGTSMFSSKEDVEKAKKDLNNFYSSDEYKIYKEKKSEKLKERSTKLDQLYYEYSNAKTAKDKQYIKSKINTFLSDDIIQKQTDGYNMQLMDVQNAYKKINSEYTNLNSAVASGKITEDQYNDQLAKLNQRRTELKENSDGVVSQMKKLEKVTGKYLLDKEKTGSFGGNLLNGFVSGLVGMIADVPETIVAENFKDVNYEALSPEEKEYISSKGYNKEQAVNYLSNKNLLKRKEGIKSGAIESMGAKETTKEYSKSKDRGWFENALVGVAQSLPGMIVPGGGVARTAAMSSQAYSSIEDEMLNDEDFETSTAAERSIIAVPYAVGMGLLEEFGFSKMISKDPLAKSLVMKSITKVLGKKGTTETLESALEKELKSNITKYGLKVVGGTLAEAETGALQTGLLDVGLKGTYNKIRNYLEDSTDEEIAALTGGGYLETPDNIKEATVQVLEGARDEAIGGAVMTAALTGFEKLSNGEITLFNDDDIKKLKELSSDPEMKKMFVAKLRTDMVEGNITKEQAKTKLEALRSVESDFTRIPDEITGPDLRRAVKLSIEKKELTKEIEGKDENLVAPKKARIEEINNELKTIGENATKESNKQEVSAEGDIVQREGTDEGQQEVGQGKGAVGETEKPSADTGDSNISSQEEEIVEETPSQSQNIIENKINEYEQGTKNESFTPDIEANARKKAKSIPRTSQALDVETNNLEDLVAKYFISGGKINVNTAVQSLFGNKGGKSVFDEYKSRIGLHSKEGKNINGLAHYLWEQNVDDPVFSSTTDSDWRNAIEQVISSNKGTKSMIDNLLSRSEEGLKNKEQEYWESQYDFDAIKEYDESELMEAESVLDNMTDEEISKMYDEIVASEKEIEASTFEEVKSLDTKNPTGLKKALDFLTEIEESLDKFGKETLGVNLPVAVAKVVIKSVKKLVQAGMSLEQAIKQAASDNNVSEKDVNDTLFALKEAKYSYERKIKAKQDNVFLNDPKTGIPKIIQKIKLLAKDQLTTRGNKTNSMFTAEEKMQGVTALNLNNVVRISKDFNKEYNSIKGEAAKEEFLKYFDDYLRGNKKNEDKLSDNAKIIANSMRNQIDNLSKYLINSGLAPSEVAKEIQENLGSYLTRSYEVFRNKNWKNKVQDQVVQKAKNLLRKQQLKNAKLAAKANGTEVDYELEILVDNKIAEYTNKINADDFLGGGKLGSKSKELGILKEKTDIPLEIRQLMGEYTDPVQNYAETVLKLSSLVAKNEFLNDVKKAGTGVYLFTEKNRPRGYDYRISAPTSEAMNPLNGMYTTPEIGKEFENSTKELHDAIKLYMKAVSVIKWNKTIGSVMTHAKNFFGNLGFVSINGHTSGFKTAYKTIKADVLNSTDPKMRTFIDRLIKNGIIKQSTGINEIRSMFKDENFDTSISKRLAKKEAPKSKVKKVIRFGFTAGKAVKSFAENAYQAEDDYFKILAYQSESERHAKAIYKKNLNELTEQERNDLDKIVVEKVKNTFPTFSRIPKIVKKLGKLPLGNFISFQAEAYRTAFKTMQIAKDELKDSNPAIKAIGAKRLIGLSIYQGMKTGIISYLGNSLGMGLSGILGYFGNDDEEKEKQKDLRKFVPTFTELSEILAYKNKDGEVSYIDISAADPHSGINKAFNAFFLADDPINGSKEAIFSMFKPFLEPEMTAKALFNVADGNNNYNKPIWNSEDEWDNKVVDISKFILKTVEPGTVTSVMKIIKSEDKLKEVIGAATGYKPVTVNIAESFGYKMKDYRDRIDDAKKIYTNTYYKKDSTDEEKEKALERSNTASEKIYKKLMEDYNSAERLGGDTYKLREDLKDRLNLSEESLKKLLLGGYIEVKPKEAEKRRIIFR